MQNQYKPNLIIQTHSAQVMEEAVKVGFMAKDNNNRTKDLKNTHPDFVGHDSLMDGQPWTLYLKDQSMLSDDSVLELLVGVINWWCDDDICY